MICARVIGPYGFCGPSVGSVPSEPEEPAPGVGPEDLVGVVEPLGLDGRGVVATPDGDLLSVAVAVGESARTAPHGLDTGEAEVAVDVGRPVPESPGDAVAVAVAPAVAVAESEGEDEPDELESWHARVGGTPPTGTRSANATFGTVTTSAPVSAMSAGSPTARASAVLRERRR
jgi:hypothetical protein